MAAYGYTPVQVPNLSGVKSIAGGNSHSLALKSDGTVWAWGANDKGQLGDGSIIERHTPVPVLNLSGVTAIAGGNSHSLALKNDGTLWAWGWNLWGQLGDGTTQDRSTPVRVQNLSGVFAIAAGGDHSLALKGNGLVSCFTLRSCTVWAWGENFSGELGAGTTNPSGTPVQVVSGEPPDIYLSGVTAIAAGLDYSLAVKTDGTVRAWGNNEYGQLGDGTTVAVSHTPVHVSNVSGVTAIAAFQGHSLAIITNGFVQAWGSNYFGQLGNGSTADRVPYAVQVENLRGSRSPSVTALAWQ